MGRFDGGNGGRGFGGGNRGGGGFRFNMGPREMHKAVCSDCKKECEVPFKPTEGKPVYCKDCYPKHKKF
ncbi:DNA-directed RNA polymerase [Candidatus Pacearchaeota archaeon]|nr:DNA-directed RNA polymerase [Candidatus Pacearchaeota archaeon]